MMVNGFTMVKRGSVVGKRVMLSQSTMYGHFFCWAYHKMDTHMFSKKTSWCGSGSMILHKLQSWECPLWRSAASLNSSFQRTRFGEMDPWICLRENLNRKPWIFPWKMGSPVGFSRVISYPQLIGGVLGGAGTWARPYELNIADPLLLGVAQSQGSQGPIGTQMIYSLVCAWIGDVMIPMGCLLELHRVNI